MKEITLEDVIAGLMFLGFDKVDDLLLGYVLESVLNSKMYQFKLVNSDSLSIYYYVNRNDYGYEIKSEDEKEENKSSLPLKTIFALNSNKALIEYLKTIDFKEIILKKMSCIGINNLSEMNYLFSSKEKGIIMDIFGIELNSELGRRK